MAKTIVKPRITIQPTRPVAVVKAAPKQISKPLPKANQKQTVNNPNSFANGAPILYKNPRLKVKESPKWGNPTKTSGADLVGKANPNVKSIPLIGKANLIEVDGDLYPKEIPLKDGSVYKPPLKKRTY